MSRYSQHLEKRFNTGVHRIEDTMSQILLQPANAMIRWKTSINGMDNSMF